MNQAVIELKNGDTKLLDAEYEKYKLKKIKESSLESDLQSVKRTIKGSHPARSVTIHCKDCSRKLFTGSDMVHREPSYFCTSEKFIRDCIKVNGKTRKFTCSDMSCCRELGRLVDFRNRLPMHMIEIKGIKLLMPDGSYVSVSKWSKVEEIFEIVKHVNF